MEKKRKIVQYRERLDRTLASPDLTNVDILKKLVKTQLQPSSELEDEGYRENLVEQKTAEVSNFLDMLRSASGKSNISHTDWKLKQDNEEFRVMYHEGLEGSPFHTLLVEGFVDGPVDVCLCISWQTSLYKKWWPQSTIPTFKILSCECLHKVQIGEQISLVRMKVSWPLSMREAVVHYYLFEYFQDDLIVVLTNSVPEPNLSGFNNMAIPEAKGVVRVDLVGGFALQKVTSERSYFRTIANMDVKLDIVPPSLINFISRQLIGNGFRLYQKAVASMMSHDKDEFSKALGEPLYARIREALYSSSSSSESNSMSSGELRQVARVVPTEELVESIQSRQKDASKEEKSNEYTNNVMSMEMNATITENRKAFGEIVEVGLEETIQTVEEDEKVNGIPGVHRGKGSVFIRAEVQEALETLDKAIKMVREHRLHSQMSSFSFSNEESPCMKTDGIVDSYPEKFLKPRRRDEVSDAVPNKDTLEGTSQEATLTNSGIQNLRYTGTNPNLTEINSNKVIPASLEQLLSSTTTEANQVANSLENGAIVDQTKRDNKQLNYDSVQDMSSGDKDKSRRKKKFKTIVTQGMSTNEPKKLSKQRKYMCCSFLY